MARYSLCGLDPRCLLCGAPASFPPCSLAARLPWKRIHSLLLRYLPICVPACVPDCLPIYLPGCLTPLLSSVSMTIVIHSQSSSLSLGVLSPQKAAKKCLPPPAPPQPFWKAPNGVIRPAGLIAPLDEGGLALVVMHSACPPMGGGVSSFIHVSLITVRVLVSPTSARAKARPAANGRVVASLREARFARVLRPPTRAGDP